MKRIVLRIPNKRNMVALAFGAPLIALLILGLLGLIDVASAAQSVGILSVLFGLVQWWLPEGSSDPVPSFPTPSLIVPQGSRLGGYRGRFGWLNTSWWGRTLVYMTVAILTTAPIWVRILAQSSYSQIPDTPYLGKLAIDDLLAADEQSRGKYFLSASAPDGDCSLAAHQYEVTNTTPASSAGCYARDLSVNTFALQVQMTVVKDSGGMDDGGGIVFRSDSAGANFYELVLTEYGRCYMFVKLSRGVVTDRILPPVTVPGFQFGALSHTIVLVAKQDHFDVFVDKQHVLSESDSTFSRGRLGLFALNSLDHQSGQTEILFSSARLWTNPIIGTGVSTP